MPDNPSGSLPSISGIGALRWQVSLYRRDQAPAASNSAVSESFTLLGVLHADIQPTYPTTFYNSAQIDIPVTHLIRVRWQDYVENTNVIRRTTTRPTDGTLRTESYRVRRVKELAGRKRFVELECELEKALTTQTDSDAEFEQVFAENPPALH
jgi:head-tail adaptor